MNDKKKQLPLTQLLQPYLGSFLIALGGMVVLAAVDRGLLSRPGIPHQFGPAAILVALGIWIIFQVEVGWRWFYFLWAGIFTVLLWGLL